MADELNEFRTRTDDKGNIRFVDHSEHPYQLKRQPKTKTPANVARQYIREVLELQRVRASGAAKRGPNIELRYVREKKIRDMTVVEYCQEIDGLPVWCSGASVTLGSGTMEVFNSSVSYDHALKSKKISRRHLDACAKALDQEFLVKCLALKRNLRRAQVAQPDFSFDDAEIAINSVRPVVYCYDAASRQRDEPKGEGRKFLGELPALALPRVDDSIKEGKHYAVLEVMVTGNSPMGRMNWRIFIEPKTGSVLYVRPLVAHACGLVFDKDPLTATGDDTIVPSSPTAVLNAIRTPRPLTGLTASAPQELRGEYIHIQDIMLPTVAPPTVAAGNFDYDATSDDFSAVNAYYHSDAVFRMVEEMGFIMGDYFDGTSFPVRVDHRGKCSQVNAKAPGTIPGEGSDGFRYGLVEASQPVGIATDRRIVLHEFGHAILWDNVWSPNFGFAHSPGDSLAAILCDPRSKSMNRFLTFPWLTLVNPLIDRRHDRDVTAGWAWGGTEDDGGYGSEQILSTSHFRAYLALGGGADDLCEMEFAARYMAYLIICGVGTLTPTTNAASPEDWLSVLATCDRSTHDFEGHAGGLVHKVLRWAFEKQGAYQGPGVPPPIVGPGEPPAVDVYINDGRNGEYGYSDDYCRTTDIWNRHQPDDGAAHQQPIPGIVNYAYTIVRNRGHEDAHKVEVRGFHHARCRCGTVCCCQSVKDMVWPNDFSPMLTERIGVGLIPSGDYALVGPFEWVPSEKDCMMMMADDRRDLNNTRAMPKSHSVPVKHLVPWDNNIALRELCPSCGAVWGRLSPEERVESG